MPDYNISKNHTDVCHEILTKASNIARFSKHEFDLIYGALNWLDDPYEEFKFCFNMDYSVNEESIYLSFEICDDYFSVRDMRHSYEEGIGGDTYTPMEYQTSAKYTEEKGQSYEWLNIANELFEWYEDDNDSVSITVSQEW
jgi:hypothetical protein